MTSTSSTTTPTQMTISTTPSIESGTSLGSRSTRRQPLVWSAAGVIAGVTGALLGLAIGLVSAGFDITRLLLGLGAVALVIGWLIALVTSPATTAASRR